MHGRYFDGGKAFVCWAIANNTLSLFLDTSARVKARLFPAFTTDASKITVSPIFAGARYLQDHVGNVPRTRQ
jgi:hypothetical protein